MFCNNQMSTDVDWSDYQVYRNKQNDERRRIIIYLIINNYKL